MTILIKPKTINIQIAANDKLVEIQKRIQQQKEWIATTGILLATTMFNAGMPVAIMIVIYIGWKHFKDLKEEKRMRETYELWKYF